MAQRALHAQITWFKASRRARHKGDLERADLPNCLLPAGQAWHERVVVELMNPLGHAFWMHGSREFSHVFGSHCVHARDSVAEAYEFGGQGEQHEIAHGGADLK